jgi:hypothetical protein
MKKNAKHRFKIELVFEVCATRNYSAEQLAEEFLDQATFFTACWEQQKHTIPASEISIESIEAAADGPLYAPGDNLEAEIAGRLPRPIAARSTSGKEH